MQDVISHLIGTNDFWRISIVSGLAGSPTRFLVGFDPKATPATMVDGMQSMSPADTLAGFTKSNAALSGAVASLDDAGWSMIAEAPPGHVPIRLLVHHALWDAWVHERDIVLPLGTAPTEEPDEIISCLRYAAALGPAFALSNEPDRRGVLVLDVTEPCAHIVVEVDGCVRVHGGAAPDGTFALRGSAVELLEALSIRRPLDQVVPAESAWLLAGLAEVFEQT